MMTVNNDFGDLIFPHVSDLFIVKNRSATSQKCHQHKPSPSSVTKIHLVTLALVH